VLWAHNMFNHQHDSRAEKFWATSHPQRVDDSGVEPLMKHWGGEAASMWMKDAALLERLAGVGRARFVGVARKTAAQRIDELLTHMALEHKRDAAIRSLSGGMKRRLAFVRALLVDPELLILDEPTTGLDPTVRHLIWERVIGYRDEGKTVLVTTHYMHEAEVLCNRIVILDNGVRLDGTGQDAGPAKAAVAQLTRDLGVTIGGRIVSYFEGNEERRTPELLELFDALAEATERLAANPAPEAVAA